MMYPLSSSLVVPFGTKKRTSCLCFFPAASVVVIVVDEQLTGGMDAIFPPGIFPPGIFGSVLTAPVDTFHVTM
jgi:hypothetical protein